MPAAGMQSERSRCAPAPPRGSTAPSPRRNKSPSPSRRCCRTTTAAEMGCRRARTGGGMRRQQQEGAAGRQLHFAWGAVALPHAVPVRVSAGQSLGVKPASSCQPTCVPQRQCALAGTLRQRPVALCGTGALPPAALALGNVHPAPHWHLH